MHLVFSFKQKKIILIFSNVYKIKKYLILLTIKEVSTKKLQ
jgi:hypothetical protein